MTNSEYGLVSPSNTQLSEKFNQLDLANIGIKESDFSAVAEACKSLEVLSASSVGEYGKDIATKTSGYTDELLTLVQNKDLDSTGDKLNQVVHVAQKLNASNILNNKSSGFFGLIFSKLRGVKQGFDKQFNSTKEQIDALVKEVETSQGGLKKRVETLEQMFLAVEDEHYQLGVYIAAGKLKQQEIQGEIGKLAQLPQDQATTQDLYDLNHVANNLEKRVSDLMILQQSAQQTLPMIRIIQSNNLMLIDKFYSIKNVTIPAWKNQISLAISLAEQQNGVQLAQNIDDATNELLKRNADLLHKNSVDTARANQRSVIDVETLEHVQNTLIKTVNDVISIQKEGQSKRDEAAKRLQALQNNLKTVILNESNAK